MGTPAVLQLCLLVPLEGCGVFTQPERVEAKVSRELTWGHLVACIVSGTVMHRPLQLQTQSQLMQGRIVPFR